MKGTVLKGQTLASIAAMQSGSIEAFPQFLIDNGFNLEDDYAVGQSYLLPENAVYKPFSSVLEASLLQDETGEYNHVVTYGQSLIDVCSQTTGTIDSLIDMMVANNLGRITDTVKAGTRIKIHRKSETRPEVVKYFSDRNMRVNNRISYSRLAAGIGFMGIEINNIVA